MGYGGAHLADCDCIVHTLLNSNGPTEPSIFIEILDLILHSVFDTIMIVPYLFVIYLLIEYLQKITQRFGASPSRLNRYGPIIGGVAGLVPSCGFAASAAVLYGKKAIKTGTLITVFLVTSDDAIPLLLSSTGGLGKIAPLILSKLIVGIGVGYLLNGIVFRNESLAEGTAEAECDTCADHKHRGHAYVALRHAAYHTLKITVFILITFLCINTIIYLIGEERLAGFLLTGSFFQPFLTALVGFIPGCSTSILITQLMLIGDVSLGAGISGLCAGAGFGYIILFRKAPLPSTLKIIAFMYVLSVATGLAVNVLVA